MHALPRYTSFSAKENQLTDVDTVNVPIQGVFLSLPNLRHLVQATYTEHRLKVGHVPFTQFKKEVPVLARMWAAGQLLQWHTSFDPNNWAEIIAFVNRRFVDEHYAGIGRTRPSQVVHDANGQYAPRDTNPFRESARVGPLNEIDGDSRVEMRHNKDMGVDDIRSLDVWREWSLNVDSSRFRNKNKIPNWQRVGHRRNYDRENEGLRDRDWRTASRPVPVRGYDMSAIVDAPRRYKNYDWADM